MRFNNDNICFVQNKLKQKAQEEGEHKNFRDKTILQLGIMEMTESEKL